MREGRAQRARRPPAGRSVRPPVGSQGFPSICGRADPATAAGTAAIATTRASAVVTALSAGGILGEGFSFVGFLPPQSKALRTAIARWAARHKPAGRPANRVIDSDKQELK